MCHVYILTFYYRFKIKQIVKMRSSAIKKEYGFWQGIWLLTRNMAFDKEYDFWQGMCLLTRNQVILVFSIRTNHVGYKECGFWQGIWLLTRNMAFDKECGFRQGMLYILILFNILFFVMYKFNLPIYLNSDILHLILLYQFLWSLVHLSR